MRKYWHARRTINNFPTNILHQKQVVSKTSLTKIILGMNKRFLYGVSKNAWQQFKKLQLHQSRVANLVFLKPEFEIMAFLTSLAFFGNTKARQNLASFCRKGLALEKTLYELHIHYKFILKRVYNHAGCAEYWKNFTVAVKMFDVIDKEQMSDTVITWTWKENTSKEWNCVISMFLTSLNVYFVFGYACFMCICLKTAIWLFFATRSGVFGEDMLATLHQRPLTGCTSGI